MAGNKKLIAENDLHLIYLNEEKEGKGKTLLKRLNSPFPNDELISQLRNEFATSKEINIKGVRKAIAFHESEGTFYLELEYIEGKDLATLIQTNKIGLVEILKICSGVCDILDELHQKGWIHGTLAPSNIIVEPFNLQPTLIDTCWASRTNVNPSGEYYPEKLSRIIHYISPEQTGRLNRLLDSRSDFYSLGVVLYEALTSQKPFHGNKLNQLIYEHLTKVPHAPIHVNPELPRAISKIIMKLLSKNPEDRYQSALGLRYDIDTAIHQIQVNDDKDFELGTKDFTGQLQIPQKLYGRKEIIQTLNEELSKVVKGACIATFIAGESGIGKSAVAMEIKKPLTKSNGFFLKGKFDQLARNIPYSAWMEIFQDFIKQILTTSDKEVLYWKTLFQSALGVNAGLLSDLIPNLKYILPNLSEPSEVGAAETQNRLNRILNQFFKAISSKEHPIVIFIDDLQWADYASLNLLKSLASDPEGRYLHLIGAYRTENLHENDPLYLKLNEIQEITTNMKILALESLNIYNIEQLIFETFNTNAEQTEELATVVFNKTQGNPYFTNQFIHSLFEEGLIKFNTKLSEKINKATWTWDIEKIRTKHISSNVAGLLINKIIELPESVIETLKIAACVGNRFGLKHLANVRGKNQEYIMNTLEIAVKEGFLFYKNNNQFFWANDNKDIQFQFAHDQVQQAFYSLIPESQRLSTHYEIGKLFYHSLKPEEIIPNIFQLLFHLNWGKVLLKDQKDKKWLAGLNLKAGQEAQRIIAYENAYEYLLVAKSLCDEFIWNTDPDFAMELGEEFLESAYLTNRFEEAEAYFNELCEKVEDPTKKAGFYFKKMTHYVHLSKIDQVLDIGLKGLEVIGLKFNPNMNRLTLVYELVKTMLMLRSKSEEDLLNLPIMKDERSRIAMSLIDRCLTFAYDRSEELMGVLGMKIMQLTVKEGLHDHSNSGFSTYGGALAIGFNNQLACVKYNKIGIKNAHRVGNKSSMGMAHFGLGMTGYGVLDHQDALKEFRQSVDLALESGAHVDAAPATMYFFFLHFLSGTKLPELRRIVLENLNLTAQLKTENFHLVLLGALSVITELQDGIDQGFKSIRGKIITNQELENRLLEVEHLSIRIYTRIFQLHNHILFGRYDLAKQCETEILKVKNVILGTILGPYFHFLRTLLYSSLYSELSASEKKTVRRMQKKTLKTISLLNKTAPQNFSHWLALLQAEYFKTTKNNSKAQEAYDRAIDLAQSKNMLNEVALAQFMCSKFNKENGNLKISAFYMQESASTFEKWGAENISEFLRNTYQTSIGYFNKKGNVKSLDQESLYRLSQLISSEIDFDLLIHNLMDVFTENAAAEKILLISKINDKWYIEASQLKDKGIEISKIQVDNALQNELLDANIYHYVKRTRETVMLDNALNDHRFSSSHYVQHNKPKSILCMPLIKKGVLTGMVYLENNLIFGAFKTDRVQLLSYISTQVAVSIENARLYSEMISLNRSYERFLPKEFLNLLGKESITEVQLGDQIQMEMTILFADIRGFSTLSEQMKPEEIFEFINLFLSRMSPVIKKFNGFVDKYIGDEIMALFPNKADDAIQCGIAMLHELQVFSDQLTKKGMQPLKIGIGVNTGYLMLGTLGAENRMNSSVISDAVNIASRVENDTKETGAPFMITKETYDQLETPSKYAIRKLGQKIYRGKSTPTQIYEVFESDEPKIQKLKNTNMNYFEKAIKHFENGDYIEALSVFEMVLMQNPEDKPAIYYKNIIEELLDKNYQRFTT